MNKKDLREELKKKRENISDKLLKDEMIREYLKAFIEKKKAQVIAFYYPIATEIDMRLLMKNLQTEGKKILLPRIVEGEMTYAVFSDEKQLKKGALGIPEPMAEVYEEDIDLLVVPGLGFNKEKHRIGYGKGYYDKYLKEHKNLTSVGCFYSELEAQFQAEIYDVMLEWILTEKGMF